MFGANGYCEFFVPYARLRLASLRSFHSIPSLYMRSVRGTSAPSLRRSAIFAETALICGLKGRVSMGFVAARWRRSAVRSDADARSECARLAASFAESGLISGTNVQVRLSSSSFEAWRALVREFGGT
eukprot:Amastigsp_a677391_7.p5 type:complete len:128 gc:universal Amastigsp_a677391_7:416-33(-)